MSDAAAKSGTRVAKVSQKGDSQIIIDCAVIQSHGLRAMLVGHSPVHPPAGNELVAPSNSPIGLLHNVLHECSIEILNRIYHLRVAIVTLHEHTLEFLMTKYIALFALMLPFGLAQANTADVTVDAKNNSTSGGSGAFALNLSAGQAYSVNVDSNDLWSAGSPLRWSNANGLTEIGRAHV